MIFHYHHGRMRIDEFGLYLMPMCAFFNEQEDIIGGILYYFHMQ